jgi:hypothetical protein
MKKSTSLSTQTLAIGLLSLGIVLMSGIEPAQAKPLTPKQKQEKEAVEKVQTFQPPPPDAMTRECEPYRAEVSALYRKPFIVRPFYAPKRAWMAHKHQKCRQSLMNQEYTYLKHADIEQAPSLPKMNAAPKPGAPNGNLP